MKFKPTDSELEILNILWEKGSGTVREIHEILEKNKDAGYTTTLKLMQIMYQKKMLTREADGKTHVYRVVVSKEQTQQQIVERIIDNVFNGSAMNLVMQALGRHKANPEELEAIKKYLDEIDSNNTNQ